MSLCLYDVVMCDCISVCMSVYLYLYEDVFCLYEYVVCLIMCLYKYIFVFVLVYICICMSVVYLIMCLYYNTDTIVCICICMSMLSVFVLKDVLSVKTVEIPSTFSINNVPILLLYNLTKPTNISTNT